MARKKKTPDWRAIVRDYNPDARFIGGAGEEFYDAAVVGVAKSPEGPYVLVYSYSGLVAALAAHYYSEGGRTKEACNEAALEWVDFNIVGAYIGANTPIILEVEADDVM